MLCCAVFQVGGSRGVIADVINEDARRCRVAMTGTLNGEAFQLERTATRSGGSKTSLTINGVDCTQQDSRLTDDIIEQRFATALMAKTLFFGQEELIGFLEVGRRR